MHFNEMCSVVESVFSAAITADVNDHQFSVSQQQFDQYSTQHLISMSGLRLMSRQLEFNGHFMPVDIAVRLNRYSSTLTPQSEDALGGTPLLLSSDIVVIFPTPSYGSHLLSFHLDQMTHTILQPEPIMYRTSYLNSTQNVRWNLRHHLFNERYINHTGRNKILHRIYIPGWNKGLECVVFRKQLLCSMDEMEARKNGLEWDVYDMALFFKFVKLIFRFMRGEFSPAA